jgi:hypothetical protein
VEEKRRWKDDHFRSAPDSPVPKEFRAALEPLDYYPVDPSWRVVRPLVADPSPEILTFISNMGEKRRIQRIGHVEFERDGAKVRVHVYRIADDPTPERAVWIPFADATAGKETYPAGRYIDSELGPDGTVVLDFNLAYNPFCAYGWSFSCPLAPAENRLKIPVRAGERGYYHP